MPGKQAISGPDLGGVRSIRIFLRCFADTCTHLSTAFAQPQFLSRLQANANSCHPDRCGTKTLFAFGVSLVG